MPPLLIRILLAILLWPLALALYLTTFLLLEHHIHDDYAIIWTGAVVALFVVVCWLELWRRHVRWTALRKRWTWIGSFGVVVVCTGIGYGSQLLLDRWDRSIGIFIASIMAITVWPIVMVWTWRETKSERADRVRQTLYCPRCDYNMTGLSESRCPECGTLYTLDELYAAQQRNRLETCPESAPL